MNSLCQQFTQYIRAYESGCAQKQDARGVERCDGVGLHVMSRVSNKSMQSISDASFVILSSMLRVLAEFHEVRAYVYTPGLGVKYMALTR